MEIFPNWTVIPTVILLIIFLFLMKRVFFIPLERMLDERHRKIEGAQKEAEDIRHASQDRLADVDRKMREARREADAYMSQLRTAALDEKGKIVGGRRSETGSLRHPLGRFRPWQPAHVLRSHEGPGSPDGRV